MVNKILAIIVIFFLSFITINAQDSLNDYEYIKVKIENEIGFQTRMENKYSISKFELISYFFPQYIKNSQYINSFNTSHEKYSVKNDSGILYLNYIYDMQTLKSTNNIENEFVVESTIYRPEIKEKILYPLKDTTEYDRYLQFANLININDEIKTQASTLAEGEDDVYVIATKIAKWIREDINYDLSTVTLNPNQKSTDVFESKAGVCKEITNLYISMMRSLGIPARVATGYAYTTSEEVTEFVGSNWGGHAWAEVLIGDEWVPFDLTYNQYGYVDATHIIFDRTYYSRNRNVMINASGYGFELVEGSLKTDQQFSVLDKKEINDFGFKITLSGPDKIGLDSYGYIKAEIENTDNFYNILFLRVAKVNEVELMENSERMEIFKPGEKKELYFRYKVNDLNPDYIYTLPFIIYNEHFSETYNITAKKGYDSIEKIQMPQEERVNNTMSEYDLVFDCNFHIEEKENLILCSVKNPNNYEINNLEICISDENCKNLDLRLNEMKSVTFSTQKFSENITYNYQRENGELSIRVNKPELNFKYTSLNEILIFDYSINNYQRGMSVNLYVNDTIKEISSKKSDQFSLSLKPGNHTLRYELAIGERVLEENEFEIEIEKIPEKSFWEKILQWFRSLF